MASVADELLKSDNLDRLKEGEIFVDKETGKRYRVRKTILPHHSSSGPHGLGDPEDRTLRRIEADVIIPNRMNAQIEKVECNNYYLDLVQCLRTEGAVRGLSSCKPQLGFFNRCKYDKFIIIMGKCQICSVDIPDGEGSQEVHETGKRHMRLRAFQESVLTLADRSVFLKWVNTEGQPILDKLAIAKVMSKSGAIDRILFRAGTTHAIVEFISISSTKDVLSQKIVHINGVKVNCCKRLMQFPSYEKQSIDINQVIVQAQESDGFIAQIDSIMEQIEINKDQILLRENCAKRLEMELGKYFVSPRVRIFGSSVTSIGIVDSDIDACLCFDATPFEQKLSPELSRDKHTLLTCDAFLLKGRRVHAEEIIRLTPADRARFLSKVLNEVRKEVGWLGQQRPIVDARCPIVRFIADKLQVHMSLFYINCYFKMLVDLSIDNYLGCAKSDYLKGLIESDISGNIRRILLGFRFWAMSNELFEPSPVQMKGHFNAYVLNLMCIGYMQSIGLIPVFSHSATEVTLVLLISVFQLITCIIYRIGIIGIEGTRVDVINIAHFLNQMLIKLKLEMGSARKEHEVLRQPDKVVTPMEE
uniref:NTP_transf_2 domain-containing protein n=1 Tax=Heterorhabditis bacteriophora TaxID=37862 RepID=A0A1I7XD17_HETBA